MRTLAAKKSNLFRLLKSQTSTNQFGLLRHLSSKIDQPRPSLAGNESSVTTQVIELLQTTDNDWNTDKLHHLLFSPADSPPSPTHLLRIARRLGSTTKALKFLEWLRSNSPQPLQRSQILSYTFQAIFELASREPNSHKKLSELLKISKDQNLPLTINSATLLVRCFARVGMVDESFLVYNDLEQSLRNTNIRNVLIDILFKSGRIDDALHLLDEMLEPNAEFRPNENTGNIVFTALFKRDQHGKSLKEGEIVELVLKLGEYGVFLDSIRLTQLVSKLCKSGMTGQAWEFLHAVMKLGGAVEATSCNALLTGLGRNQDINRMNLLLIKMKEMDIQPTVVTFGILINHLCKARRIDGALEVFEKMTGGGDSDGVAVKPDVIIYNTLIDGFCKVGRQEEGLGLMAQMKSQFGCTPNTATYNCLIDGFCKAGEIGRSLELFDQMNEERISPNAVTLNTLVDGMCRNGKTSTALEFFTEMKDKGLKGNAVTYTSLIKAFCNTNNIAKAMELFNEMLKAGCRTDAIVYYTLISNLSLAGRLDDAIFVTSKLKEAGFGLDLICYNVLISGFCKKKRLDKARDLLKEMEVAQMKPDSVTYNTLISHLSKSGDFITAHRELRKMLNAGLVPTVVTYGTLIHSYCLHGYFDEAMEIFKGMSSASVVPPNTIIYNILIDSLCKNNQVEVALSLMDDMKVKEVRPNTTTYNTMFKGLQEKNWVEKTFELMDRMTEEACNPDYITMEILTDWLPAVGEEKKLRSFVQGYEVCASAA